MPRAAAATAPAALPPHLPGLDPAWSRLVATPAVGPEHAPGGPSPATRTWHLLDNAGQLAELGVEPVGTVLCVHGNPTWSYLWRSVLTAATETARAGGPAWRVVAVDQLDMGYSERSGVPRGLAQRVADLGALTDELGLTGPVVTLGHDWGGVVSLGWAVDHPDLLAGVVVCNTAVHQPADAPIPAPLRLALRPSVLGRATVLTPGFLETTLAIAHPPLPAPVRDAYRSPYRGADRRGGIGGFVADIPVDDRHPSAVELDRIAEGVRALGVPALVLWGPRDPVFLERYLDDLATRMPHADVHRFEGAGHLLPEDVDVAGAVLAWLGDRLPEGHVPTEVGAGLPADADADADTDTDTDAGAGLRADADVSRPVWAALDELADADDVALVEMAPGGGRPPRSVSWRLLSRRVREIAAGLADAGVQRGDRVSLLVTPGADLTAVLYACVRIGAVVVVADAGLGVRGLTRAVRGARPDWLVGALPGLTAARALGWPGRRIATPSVPPAARVALGVEHTLAGLARRGAARLRAGVALPAAPAPTDTAAVLFTSGSTGPAKGVVYTHAQLAAVRDALATQYGVGVGTGLVAGFAPFALLGPALGARSVTPDMDVTAPRTLTARAVAAAAAAAAPPLREIAVVAAQTGSGAATTAISAEGTAGTEGTGRTEPSGEGVVVFLSPAALANVVATADALTAEDHAALGRVRLFLSAGAPVPEPLLAEAARLMPAASAHTPYGMTEGLLMTDIDLAGIRAAAVGPAHTPARSQLSPVSQGSERQGLRSRGRGTGAGTGGGVCVGEPAAGVAVRIAPLDDLGAATGPLGTTPEVTGEIVLAAPHGKDHYDRLWLTDLAARRQVSTDRRWHRTGDVGHLDADGRLWVEGRLPHVVATASGVVTPVGPEQRIESVPEVDRAAVVGVGPAGTQQVVAVVETTPAPRRPHLADPALAERVRATVDVPVAAVLVVPRLPTDIRHNSKIDRTRVARWAAGVLAGGRMVRP
ncbi:hydrolase [Curtobacterium sp. MCBD17_019]|nr:hydrolase [Curtobacterium sp. MCBD17_019]